VTDRSCEFESRLRHQEKQGPAGPFREAGPFAFHSPEPAMSRTIFLLLFCAAFQLLPVLLSSNCPHPEIPSPPLAMKIGQMLMVGFHGSTLGPNHPLRNDISERHLGGVILLNQGLNPNSPASNIHNPAQLRELTRELQSISPTPLLIAVDQEGGRVCRLKESSGFPPSTSFARLGRENNPAHTRRQAKIIARTLRAAGINFNLSPVVDLDKNPDNPIIGALGRSF
jgi:beta-N-acetylhexosaminidase